MNIVYSRQVERWAVQEIILQGPDAGNPFTEQWVKGVFNGPEGQISTEGFYDGEGRYMVRFMPSYPGEYTFEVTASFMQETVTGTFEAEPAASGNHGPVRVASQYHFAYEDGTSYFPLGTTCYVWTQQSDALMAETLKSLQEAGFNKIRFCVMPKHYSYNLHEPRTYPYEGTPMDSSVLTVDNFNDYNGNPPGNHWQFDRFNPEHFRHLEEAILALQKINVEADLIVMHPYDRWGFSCMTREQDTLYWKYVLARFSAFRNVWWSLANEYDLLREKKTEDWEHYAALILQHDPYHHLRSIHNCGAHYDHTRPWITHCSIQRQGVETAELTDQWRVRYGKPVVLDEISYEGDIQFGWGNITGEEMIRRFWEGACRGGYPGHGETFLGHEDILWWSHGGTLHGESWKRVRFLMQILRETPGGCGLKRKQVDWDSVTAVPENDWIDNRAGYELHYYGHMRPSFRDFSYADSRPRRVEIIDTWNMTVTDMGVYTNRFRIPLPARQYMAIRVSYDGNEGE